MAKNNNNTCWAYVTFWSTFVTLFIVFLHFDFIFETDFVKFCLKLRTDFYFPVFLHKVHNNGNTNIIHYYSTLIHKNSNRLTVTNSIIFFHAVWNSNLNSFVLLILHKVALRCQRRGDRRRNLEALFPGWRVSLATHPSIDPSISRCIRHHSIIRRCSSQSRSPVHLSSCRPVNVCRRTVQCGSLACQSHSRQSHVVGVVGGVVDRMGGQTHWTTLWPQLTLSLCVSLSPVVSTNTDAEISSPLHFLRGARRRRDAI